MAKRKRLTPAQTDYLETVPAGLETKSMPFAAPPAARAPVAQVAGEASAAAALEDLAGEVRRAREEGRMIQALPLGEVDAGYLTRDRIAANTEEIADLVASIRERGQQTPIEVVALENGRYGLISGWRRLTALQRLHAETGEGRFASVLAILRRPDTASDAYVAMVEENEVRLGLSYFERARIVAKSVEQGVYESEKQALGQLFSTASRPKRSKIKSFLALVHGAGDLLRFPNAINERLGVALSREIQDDRESAEILRGMLAGTRPETAEAELALLQDALARLTDKQSRNTRLGSNVVPRSVAEGKAGPDDGAEPGPPAPETRKPVGTPDEYADAFTLVYGVKVTYVLNTLQLQGWGVTKTFRDRLFAWIIAEQERIAEEIAGN